MQRLIFLGSSCIYPRRAPQPLKEEYLLTGPLEETNRPYAIAKIAGIELCRSLNREYGTDYLSLMPTNLYGPGDNFDLETSHVLPALIRKFHEAKQGCRTRPAARRPGSSGAPARPGASSCTWTTSAAPSSSVLRAASAADVPDGLVNVGCGEDHTIADLAGLVQRVVGYEGQVEWDAGKPDGTPRKLMDVSRAARASAGPAVGLEDGLRPTYDWYLAYGEQWPSEEGTDDQDRAHHRHHRPGRRLPGRATPRTRATCARHQAPRQLVQHRPRGPPLPGPAPARRRASSCTTAT